MLQNARILRHVTECKDPETFCRALGSCQMVRSENIFKARITVTVVEFALTMDVLLVPSARIHNMTNSRGL